MTAEETQALRITALETQLEIALASLASTQAALQRVRLVARIVTHEDQAVIDAALAANCAAEWLAKLDRRTKALEEIPVHDLPHTAECQQAGLRCICWHAKRQLALEDQ